MIQCKVRLQYLVAVVQGQYEHNYKIKRHCCKPTRGLIASVPAAAYAALPKELFNPSLGATFQH
jgi:hypothetical protein